ncbi:hypothetical protein REPUB_Repub09cG0054100 [Reevesia pubescens]
MRNPHILVIPYPVQGHVDDLIHLVSIPDGLEDGEDRNDHAKLTAGMIQVMTGELTKLIEKINSSKDDKIMCIVADMGLGWAMLIAAELGIKKAVFHPASTFSFVLIDRIPQMIQDRVIDENGSPINKHQMIQLLPNTPVVKRKHLWWTNVVDLATQQLILEYLKGNHEAILATADWLICNSAYDLEPGVFTLAAKPKLLPIGSLSISNQLENLPGNFWSEDTTCLEWLDQQPRDSVIYLSFGSLLFFDQIQFQELALGLELSNRPLFLVVRPDTIEGKEDL